MVRINPARVPLQYVLSISTHFSVLLVTLIFSVTFIAITGVERIKDLRYAGIRLISSQKMIQIMRSSFLKGGFWIGISLLSTWLLSFGVLLAKGLSIVAFFPMILLATGLYGAWLTLLSLIYVVELLPGSLPSYCFGR